MTTTELFEFSKVRHVWNEADLRVLIDTIKVWSMNGQPCVFDLETTCLDENLPYSRVACATFTFPDRETWMVGLSHPEAPLFWNWRVYLQQLAIAMLDGLWIGQNVVFDVRWIWAMTGIDLSETIHTDTMLGSHLLSDQTTTALKPRAALVFGIPQWDDFSFKVVAREQELDPRIGRVLCPRLSERVPYFELAEYACADTYWTWRLYEYQYEALKLDPAVRETFDYDEHVTQEDAEILRMGLYKQAIGDRSITSLCQMQMHGMAVDREWCKKRLADNELRLQELEAELIAMPRDPWWDNWEEKPSFNPNSKYFKRWAGQLCHEGQLRVVGMTKGGDTSWNAACLIRNVKLGYTAAAVLQEYRTKTIENQYLRVWIATSERTGRVHANFNFARTRTGRLSSSEPNLQQVSRAMKDAFYVPDGKLLVAADYSMIEIRVAAHLAQPHKVVEALWAGQDLHTLMAAAVAGCEPHEVTKEQRQRAKAVNFGFLFGMGAPKFVDYAEISYGVDYTEEEAWEVRRLFFEMWEGLAEWHQERREEVRNTGQVVCPLGRIRRLPNGKSKNKYDRGMAERAAINTPVQSTASDMMLVATNLIREYAPEYKPVAIVHDAIVLEVDEDQAEECGLFVKRVMEEATPKYIYNHLGEYFTVPFVADISISKSWGGTS